MLQTQLPFTPSVIHPFCQKWQITELCLFGSVLRDDFRPDSDIDILVTFSPTAPWTLLDLVNMEYELQDLLGREVDLIEKPALEKSNNWIRRNEILNTAQVIYSQPHELP
jgi:predicted nucleotidyltransferase